MNAKLISKTLLSTALTASSIMLLSGAPAAAASNRQDLEDFNQSIALKEAGFSFPAIEESLKVRREAIARAEAKKAAKVQTALVRSKDETLVKN